MSATGDDLLGVHVFGPGWGESILLEIPCSREGENKRWAIIDCFRTREKKSYVPPLGYLHKRGVRSLAFACRTHAHEDHCRGFSEVIKGINIDRWWENAGFSDRLCAGYYRLSFFNTGARDHRARNLYEELLRQRVLLRPHRHGMDSSRFRKLTGYHRAIWCSTSDADGLQVVVSALAPHSATVSDYETALAQALERLDAEEEGSLEPINVLLGRRQNDLSVVLLATFGETRLILGGDASKEAWDEILKDGDRIADNAPLACNLLKVSHHGSGSSYSEQAWCEHDKPVAIITPFESNRLPKPKMLGIFKKLSERLEVTGQMDDPRTLPDVVSLRIQMGAYGARPVFTERIIGFSMYFDSAGKLRDEAVITHEDCR